MEMHAVVLAVVFVFFLVSKLLSRGERLLEHRLGSLRSINRVSRVCDVFSGGPVVRDLV